MWLILLRLGFGAVAVWFVRGAWLNAQADPTTGDLANAGFLMILVILALANAAVWAPFFGARLSEPLTGVITRSTYVERPNHMLRLLAWLDARGSRRPAALVALVEGLRHPNLPTPFVLGLRNTRPGSWLEWVFAREVWRFDNLQNCSIAYRVLRRQGIDPRPHRNPEVNRALMAQEREPAPERPRLDLPPTPELIAPQRDFRIRLFNGAIPAAKPSVIDEAAETAAAAQPPNDHESGS